MTNRWRGLRRLLPVMGLGALVLFVIGILRPLRSAFALSGLPEGDFYQVYFVSAVVIVIAPIYNRLSDRISWRRLIPATAVFFAASLVVFRLIYQPEAAWFGLVFYGWYDVLAASLIAEFYMATQIFYNARDAKRAYPLVIASSSAGATLGALTHVVAPDGMGSENMLFVAAAALVAFGVGIRVVWSREVAARAGTDGGELESSELRRPAEPRLARIASRLRVLAELRGLAANSHIRLIGLTVLLTVMVKQFIDYQYNTLTREVYTDVSSIAGFQGLVDALTQWLPMIVLFALWPVLQRMGVAVAVMVFPVAIIIAAGALAASAWLSAAMLWVAVASRSVEKMFRYSAERAGREILYIPVPDELKLKAKSYIDISIEKGLGKTLSGGLIALLALLSVTNRMVIVGAVGLGFAIVLFVAFLKVRNEYVKSLAQSFAGRFASLRGSFVSMTGTGATRLAREALRDREPLKVIFALDLLNDAAAADIEALSGELNELLEHDDDNIRAGALDALRGAPSFADEPRVRAQLSDESPQVRLAAVRVLALRAEPAGPLLAELISSGSVETSSAALACLAVDFSSGEAESIVTPEFDKLYRRRRNGHMDTRDELALARAAALVPNHPLAVEVTETLLNHQDDAVASAAVESAAKLPQESMVQAAIAALAEPGTRGAARTSLAERGEDIADLLLRALADSESSLWVRRGVASILGDIASRRSIDALITSYLLPETEQALDDQALLALHRLRAAHGHLSFPADRVLEAADREVRTLARYKRASPCVRAAPFTRVARRERSTSPTGRGTAPDTQGIRQPGIHKTLLLRALEEAQRDRSASIFRWLGLIYPAQQMYRSHLALASSNERLRANAVEWIERTVGRQVYRRLQPALAPGAESATAATEEDAEIRVENVLRELWDDEDSWIARCALWTAFEYDPALIRREADVFRSADPALERTFGHLLQLAGGAAGEESAKPIKGDEMELIEKVFLLQKVDLLSSVKSSELALLASIARTTEAREGTIFIDRGEPTDALYVVVRGAVELHGVGNRVIRREAGEAFGTWALIDEQASVVQARAAEATQVLQIAREDFRDLIIDHPVLSLAVLRGFARRVRELAPA